VALRRSVVVLVALTAAAAVLAAVPAAGTTPRRIRAYAGETSAGGEIVFRTSVRDDRVRLLGVGLEGTITCEDGSSSEFAGGIAWGGGLPMPDGRIDVEDVFLNDALLIHGRLGMHRGSGTIESLGAALDASEQPQICTTGELTWSVERVSGRAARGLAGPGVATLTGDGVTKTFRVSPADGRSRAPTDGRLRSYEGRTSARDRLFVATLKRPDSVSLVELGFEWGLACDDQSEIGLGFFILFAEEPLEPGRLDYDLSAPEIALHVHGRLGLHAGEGTVSAIVPALTGSLTAMGCRTGDLTWTAWRTDAGA
jgi:hypothetical protein